MPPTPLPPQPPNIYRRCVCSKLPGRLPGITKSNPLCHQPHCPESDRCKGCGKSQFLCKIMGPKDCPLSCITSDYLAVFNDKSSVNARNLKQLDNSTLRKIYSENQKRYNIMIGMLDPQKDDDKFIIQQIQNLLNYIKIVLDYTSATDHHMQSCLRKCIKLRQFFNCIRTMHMAHQSTTLASQ